MKLLKQLAMLAGFAFVAVQAGPAVSPAQAGTPNDTLIMAKNIDDIIVLDPAEVDFPYDESTSFLDVETGRKVPVVPDKLRDQYRQLIKDHIEELSQLCNQNRIDYAFMNTKIPLDHALFKYLAMRHRLTKAR